MSVRFQDLRVRDDDRLDPGFFNRRYRLIAQELQTLAVQTASFGETERNLLAAGLARIDEIIAPAIAAIEGAVELGFLAASSSTSVQIPAPGNAVQLNVDEGGGARLIFKPTPFMTVMRSAEDAVDDWAVIRRTAYDPETGDLIAEVIYRNGMASAFDDYVIAASGGFIPAMATVLGQINTAKSGVDATLADIQVAIDAIIEGGAVLSVAGKTGAVTLGIADISSLQTALNGKANTSHGHTIAQVTNLQTSLDGKAALSHAHAIANVTGLQAALDGKAGVTGAGASGSWGISITGNAATATNAVGVSGASSNGFGSRTVSTGNPTGGANGDIWLKVE